MLSKNDNIDAENVPSMFLATCLDVIDAFFKCHLVQYVLADGKIWKTYIV